MATFGELVMKVLVDTNQASVALRALAKLLKAAAEDGVITFEEAQAALQSFSAAQNQLNDDLAGGVEETEDRVRSLQQTTNRRIGLRFDFASLAKFSEQVFFIREGIRTLAAPIGQLVTAANEVENSNRKLESTSKLTGAALESLQETAAQTKDEFSLNTIVSNELTISLTKLTQKAGDVDKTASAIARLLDLGSAQGLTAQETLTAIQQAILGLDEGTDKLFQKNPSVIYAEFAQQIGTTAGRLTDQQKAQALLNAVLTDGLKVQGEYNRFLESSAGIAEANAQRTQELRAQLGSLVNDVYTPLLELANPVLEFFTGLDKGTQRATLASIALLAIVRQLAPALAALNVSAGGIGAIFLAISAGIALFTTRVNAAETASEELAEVEFNALTNSLQQLNTISERTNAENEKRKTIIEQLNQRYSSYLGNLDLDKAKNDELRVAVRQANEEIQKRIAIRAAEEEVQESLETSVQAERAYRDAVSEQSVAQKRAEDAAKKRINVESGIAPIIDEQKRATLEFLESVGRRGSLSVATPADQLNRELELTQEFFTARAEQLEADVENTRAARDQQITEYQAFLDNLNELSAAVVTPGGSNPTPTPITLQTPENDETTVLTELRIQNITNEFEQRRQIVEESFRVEVEKYRENAEIVNALEIRRSQQLFEIKQQEAATLVQVAEEQVRAREQVIAREFDIRREAILQQFREETELAGTNLPQLIQAERTKTTQLRVLNEQETEFRRTQIEQSFTREVEAYARQSEVIQEIERQKFVELGSVAAGSDAANAIESRFAAERAAYLEQSDFVISLERDKQLQISQINEQLLEDQRELFQEQAEQINSLAESQIGGYQVLLDGFEAGFDTFTTNLFNKSLSTQRKLDAIWEAMRASFIGSLAEMTKEVIRNKLRELVVHQASERGKTAISAQQSAARGAISLKALAAEAAGVVKSIGVFLGKIAVKLFDFFASLGPVGILLGIGSIPALIATVRGVVSSVSKFAEGGVVTGPTLGLLGEAGSPEAAIPLNEQGAEFISRLIPKIVVAAPSGDAVGLSAIRSDLVNAIQNVRIELRSDLDAIDFFRKNLGTYEKLEKARTFE